MRNSAGHPDSGMSYDHRTVRRDQLILFRMNRQNMLQMETRTTKQLEDLDTRMTNQIEDIRMRQDGRN